MNETDNKGTEMTTEQAIQFHVKKLYDLVNIADTNDMDTTAPEESLSILTPLIVKAEEAPWMVEARKWEGKSELYDEAELTAFLGINPNDKKPDGKPWCGAFVGKTLTAANIMNPDSLTATDYAYKGDYHFYKCGCLDGAIAVFDEKPGSPYKGGHVGYVCKKGTKLLGGNQGDSVRESNLKWYLDSKMLVGYYCPNGYELT